MGMLLYYTTTKRVSEAVEDAIRAELESYEGGEQPWILCEPPYFYPTGPDGKLHGGSKLNLHPWPEEWDEAQTRPGPRNDLLELLRLLGEWSRRHQVDWELSIEEEPLGRIEQGVCPEDLQAKVEALAGLAEHLAEEFPHEPEPPPDRPQLRIWPEPE